MALFTIKSMDMITIKGNKIETVMALCAIELR